MELLAPEGPPDRECGLQVGDLHTHHPVRINDVGLFDEGAILRANHGNRCDVNVAAAQVGVEGEDDFPVRLQIPAWHPGLVEG